MNPAVVSCCEWLVMIYNDMKLPFEADMYEEKRRKVQSGIIFGGGSEFLLLTILKLELDVLGITVSERIVDY